MADYQVYTEANDLNDQRNAYDDDGQRRCDECLETFQLEPGSKSLLSCLDHITDSEELMEYAREIQTERNRLRKMKETLSRETDEFKNELNIYREGYLRAMKLLEGYIEKKKEG